MITSQHSRSDTSSPTIGHGTGRFLSGRIKDTSETKERETLFKLVSTHGLDLVGFLNRQEFAGKTKNSKTLFGKSVHLSSDLVLSSLIQVASDHGDASVHDSLDSTFEETDDVRLLIRSSVGVELVGDRHSLDRRIKGVFDDQLIVARDTSNRGSVGRSRWLP